MRLLTENEMVELVESTEADRSLLVDRMAPLRPDDGQPAPWLESAVKNSLCKVVTVTHAGIKLGAFWYWFSRGNKALVINAAASFVGFDTYEYFICAYRHLARQIGATSIQAQTRRSALLRKYIRNGWQADGVVIRFDLTGPVL